MSRERLRYLEAMVIRFPHLLTSLCNSRVFLFDISVVLE